MTLERFLHKREHEKYMQVRSIEYSRTFRVAEYESERIQVAAELDQGDDLDQSLQTLKAQVMRLHENLATLEPPKSTIPVTQKPSVPYGFDPTEFLDFPGWKRGGRKPDGSYDKGNWDYGWTFLYEDKEHTKPTFSKAATDLLKKGPINIGDDYTLTLNDTGTFVTIKTKKK